VPLTHLVLHFHITHSCAKSRRHYQFFESTSFSARLSSVRSATTCFHAPHGLPSPPPAKRTYHLLSQPDISCATDTRDHDHCADSEILLAFLRVCTIGISDLFRVSRGRSLFEKVNEHSCASRDTCETWRKVIKFRRSVEPQSAVLELRQKCGVLPLPCRSGFTGGGSFARNGCVGREH
jgi:hypothetical protein